MNNKTMKELTTVGFDKSWLEMVNSHFKPKKKGRFNIEVFDIEDISQEPDTGIFVEESCFSTERELSIIHFFFEGFGYVMKDNETGEEIGRGIIDGAPFDEVEEVIGEQWCWLNADELGAWYSTQRKNELEKLSFKSKAKSLLDHHIALIMDRYDWNHAYGLIDMAEGLGLLTSAEARDYKVAADAMRKAG